MRHCGLSEPRLICRQLSKTYRTATGEFEALHAIDVEVLPGSVTALVGASGSGKSTLLRLFAGLDRATSGELIAGGRNLTTATPRELREHRLAEITFVNQKPADNLIPHRSLREHAEAAGTEAFALLDDVGLAHRLDSWPVELSGGEQARAAFALAIARNTPLVVIDEPTAELDRPSAVPLLEAIRRHASQGVAIVIATHDHDVTEIADHVIRLERGRRIEDDAAETEEATPQRPAPADRPVLLDVQGLAKSFHREGEEIHAVRDIDLSLAEQTINVLLGRSGSGKSTLLTLLAGLQPADRGVLRWRGEAVDAAKLPWSQLSYIPQRFGLIPELTVRENIELPQRLAGITDPARTEELLDALDLREFADRTPPETSIGQQQRVAIARALILRPALLLADEPTSHQDQAHHDAVWEHLAEAAESGTTTLAATHEETASRWAAEVWAIAEGTISPR